MATNIKSGSTVQNLKQTIIDPIIDLIVCGKNCNLAPPLLDWFYYRVCRKRLTVNNCHAALQRLVIVNFYLGEVPMARLTCQATFSKLEGVFVSTFS